MSKQTAARAEPAAPARKQRRDTGREAVYAEVCEAIVDHRLPPGTKLSEDALGEAFGVGRTVVRKALFRLAHEKIVRLRPNRGAVVASPSRDEARDVFETRRVLEASVVGRLTDRLTPRDLGALRALVVEERDAYERGERRGWIRLSGEFHVRLAELAGNAVAADFLKELVSRTSLIIALYESPGAEACSIDEHLALLSVLEAGDASAASALMDDHLGACEDRLDLDEANPSVDFAEVFAGARQRRGGSVRQSRPARSD